MYDTLGVTSSLKGQTSETTLSQFATSKHKAFELSRAREFSLLSHPLPTVKKLPCETTQRQSERSHPSGLMNGSFWSCDLLCFVMEWFILIDLFIGQDCLILMLMYIMYMQ